MKTFLLTSKKYNGEVKIFFDDKDSFAGIIFYESTASVEQRAWYLHNLASDTNAIGLYRKLGIEVTEVRVSITFEDFWIKYNDKENSSKKKTEKVWIKLPEKEQIKAYNYIDKYIRSIPPGCRKKYATTYLADELWNN